MNPSKWINESHFTREFCKELTQYNCKCTAIVGHRDQESGLPDRVIWGTGIPGEWFEFKKDSGGLSAKQRIFIEATAPFNRTMVIRIVGRDTIWVETLVGKELVKVLGIRLPATGKELRAFLIEARDKAELRFPYVQEN